MIKVVINWVYYKENKFYSYWNARQKKDCVFFYDYDDYAKYIIDSMSLSELQRLRLNIYNKYHKLIKFTRFWEKNNDWEVFEWYKLESPIIEIDSNEFALLLPSVNIRKRFFIRDSIREKYFYKSKFINYINMWCLSM